MKALISPNELFDVTWVLAWSEIPATDTTPAKWEPVYSSISGCYRIAQVEPDNKVFEVAQPLHWVDCPDNCVADQWYYKDGQVQIKPENVPKPQGE